MHETLRLRDYDSATATTTATTMHELAKASSRVVDGPGPSLTRSEEKMRGQKDEWGGREGREQPEGYTRISVMSGPTIRRLVLNGCSFNGSVGRDPINRLVLPPALSLVNPTPSTRADPFRVLSYVCLALGDSTRAWSLKMFSLGRELTRARWAGSGSSYFFYCGLYANYAFGCVFMRRRHEGFSKSPSLISFDGIINSSRRRWKNRRSMSPRARFSVE